jgi:anti-sigma B factor antagonist
MLAVDGPGATSADGGGARRDRNSLSTPFFWSALLPPATESTRRYDFTCEVTHADGCATVRPAGELDMATVELVEAPLRDVTSLGFREVVLDLRGLTFLDSTGISLLVRWQRLARGDGFRFGIVMGDERILRPLEITGVLGVLDVVHPAGGDPRPGG